MRDRVSCLVHPVTTHLASLGDPTWFARVSAQVVTDPALRVIMAEEALAKASSRHVVETLLRLLPDMPADVRQDRAAMVRHLIVHVCAERERAVAEGTATPPATRDEAATGLIDAITGLWTAPHTAWAATDRRPSSRPATTVAHSTAAPPKPGTSRHAHSDPAAPGTAASTAVPQSAAAGTR